MADITELTLQNWQTTADLLRHLADNEIDSDSFAVTHENENGKETECELSITDFALRAAADIDAMLAALAQRDAQIAALTAENVALKDLARGWASATDVRLFEQYGEVFHGSIDDCEAELKRICSTTDAAANALRAEGIYFAANRILAAWDCGFIDDTPAQAYDISGAVLSAIEFLPTASPGEFKRDFADSIRKEIKASAAKEGK